MSPKIWVVVLNWNGAEDTVECVESCLKIDYPSYQILIVDNHSDDDSADIFRRRFPNVPLIVNETNTGYAGGNNFGIKHALRQGADYILLLNNDVVVEPNVLTELTEGMRACPRATMAAPKVLYYENRQMVNSMGTSIDWFKMRPFLGECNQIDSGQYTQIVRKDILVGCALMLRCNALDQMGLLDEKFFILNEETDWCFRNLRLGHENIVVPRAVVYHKGSNTIRHFSEITHYYSVRNFLYMCQKNARGIDRLKTGFGFFLLSIKNILKLILGSRQEQKMARVFFDASYDYFHGVMGKCARSYS